MNYCAPLDGNAAKDLDEWLNKDYDKRSSQIKTGPFGDAVVKLSEGGDSVEVEACSVHSAILKALAAWKDGMR